MIVVNDMRRIETVKQTHTHSNELIETTQYTKQQATLPNRSKIDLYR